VAIFTKGEEVQRTYWITFSGFTEKFFKKVLLDFMMPEPLLFMKLITPKRKNWTIFL